jgi:hypothetical protein
MAINLVFPEEKIKTNKLHLRENPQLSAISLLHVSAPFFHFRELR